MEEMIKEAAANGADVSKNPLNDSLDPLAMTGRSHDSMKTITRRSLAVLAGDENDLLSASPVFNVDLPMP